MKNTKRIPCSIIRGGTSKGVYILQSDLPEDRSEWDEILLKLMGSPDRKQIDGLGGATSVTSKVAIVRRSEREDDGCRITRSHRYPWTSPLSATRETAETSPPASAHSPSKSVW